MMKIFRGTHTAWYDVLNPTRAEVDELKKELNIHTLVIEEMRAKLRRAKLDLYPEYLNLVIHVPLIAKGHQGVSVTELDCIVGKQWLVTNRYRTLPVLTQLSEQLSEEESAQDILNKPVSNLLYFILSSILQDTVSTLDQGEERVDKIEKHLFSGTERELVQEISELRRDIIDFRRITSAARPVFRTLDDAGPALLGQDTLPYFRNLTGRSEQVATLLKAQKETIEALEETNQALLTTRTNDIFRILTIFASIALPLTLIASIFGMNVGFPERLAVFEVILGMMAITALGMLMFFKKKNWL